MTAGSGFGFQAREIVPAVAVDARTSSVAKTIPARRTERRSTPIMRDAVFTSDTPSGFPLEERGCCCVMPVGPAFLRGAWGSAIRPIWANGQPTDEGGSRRERSSSIDVRVISLSLCDHERTMGALAISRCDLRFGPRANLARRWHRALVTFLHLQRRFARLAKHDPQLFAKSRRPAAACRCGNYGVGPGNDAARRAGRAISGRPPALRE